jgi:hypothetical protein
MFHADHPSLLFIGLVQPLGSIWPLADLQSKLAANYIIGNYELPADIRDRARREIENMQRQFIRAYRHTIEVEGFEHERELRRIIPSTAPKWGAHV